MPIKIMLQFVDRKALSDCTTDWKRIEDDELSLQLLIELTRRCFSLPLTDAEVLVDNGSDKKLLDRWKIGEMEPPKSVEYRESLHRQITNGSAENKRLLSWWRFGKEEKNFENFSKAWNHRPSAMVSWSHCRWSDDVVSDDLWQVNFVERLPL